MNQFHVLRAKSHELAKVVKAIGQVLFQSVLVDVFHRRGGSRDSHRIISLKSNFARSEAAPSCRPIAATKSKRRTVGKERQFTEKWAQPAVRPCLNSARPCAS